jgi:hypothetical protein
MRRVFMLLLTLSALLIPCFGCESKPDPREREDFVDTTDPSAVGGMLDDTRPGAEQGPGAKPAPKTAP